MLPHRRWLGLRGGGDAGTRSREASSLERFSRFLARVVAHTVPLTPHQDTLALLRELHVAFAPNTYVTPATAAAAATDA